MIKISNYKIPLSKADAPLKELAAAKLKISVYDIIDVKYLKKSIDARKKNDILIVLTIAVTVKNEKTVLRKFTGNPNISSYTEYKYQFPTVVSSSERPVVVGFGPAGMFAALILAKAGLKPIILERGNSAAERKKSVDIFRKTGKLDTENNVQFGEGGAGTFSDGKLNTGINDPRIKYVFETFVEHGAPDDILYNAKPHIGTDYLVNVVQNIRKTIEDLGGEIKFGAKFTGLEYDKNNCLRMIYFTQNNMTTSVKTSKCILATGHSARDVFRLLKKENVSLTAKNFAMGLRIEHLQEDLDKCMYGLNAGNNHLPAADYKLAVHLPDGNSLYTFCMCPGGEVVASSSEENRLVVNGMSYHARNGKNANSALLVGVTPEMLQNTDNDPLAGMILQEKIEEKAFAAGGFNYNAPVCLVGDFLEGKKSDSFGKVKPTYIPGVQFSMPDDYLPEFMLKTLRQGIPAMGKKLSLFNEPEAILTGVESRSSSPVRILRNQFYQSVSISGLYPCGEGAGYAGGITSAAVDGIKCAEALIYSMN
ncbi:MAG: NAD(P)/FAD-dependent oxidoreductase [Ruminococcus sp.]